MLLKLTFIRELLFRISDYLDPLDCYALYNALHYEPLGIERAKYLDYRSLVKDWLDIRVSAWDHGTLGEFTRKTLIGTDLPTMANCDLDSKWFAGGKHEYGPSTLVLIDRGSEYCMPRSSMPVWQQLLNRDQNLFNHLEYHECSLNQQQLVDQHDSQSIAKKNYRYDSIFYCIKTRSSSKRTIEITASENMNYLNPPYRGALFRYDENIGTYYTFVCDVVCGSHRTRNKIYARKRNGEPCDDNLCRLHFSIIQGSDDATVSYALCIK